MVLREVAASNKHIATSGQKTEAFRAVANALNFYTEHVPVVDTKIIRNRYERLQNTFDSKDLRGAMRSRVGEKVNERHRLLPAMREA